MTESNIVEFRAPRRKRIDPSEEIVHWIPTTYVLDAASRLVRLPNPDPAWRSLVFAALSTDDDEGLCALNEQEFEWFTQVK